MLRRNDAIPNGFDPSDPITGSVWRWIGCGVDIIGGGPIVLAMFPSVEAARSYDARTPQGELLPQDQRAVPMGTRQYQCQGMAFAALSMRDWPGTSLSERLTAAVYAHILANVPEFAGAEDIGP